MAHKVDMFDNPLTPMSDQDRISPYNIKQTSDENKKKIYINYRIICISSFNTKFSELTS